MLPFIPLEENSVLDQIGGTKAVKLVVDDFYDRVFKDTMLLSFFQHVNRNILNTKMNAFFKMALGGPVKYTGKNLRQAHAHLVLMGLSDLHFDRVALYLDHALKKYGVGVEMRERIALTIGQYRNAVLNQ